MDKFITTNPDMELIYYEQAKDALELLLDEVRSKGRADVVEQAILEASERLEKAWKATVES